MFVTVFFVVLLVALALTIFGEFIDMSLTLIGCTLLFILGVVMLTTGIEYGSGETVTEVYNYDNFSGEEDGEWELSLSNITASSQTDYTAYSGAYSHMIAFVLAIAGVFGFIVTILKIKEDRKEKDPEAQVEI